MKFFVLCLCAGFAAILCSCTQRTYKDPTFSTEGSSPRSGAGTGNLSDFANVDTAIHGTMGAAAMQGAKQIEAKSTEDMLRIASPENLIFTDPDDPYADIKELDEAFAAARDRKYNWHQSYQTALREARRSGKPILIWFHDSVNSPTSISLGREILTKSDFDSWATNNIVRIRYDKSERFPREPGQTADEVSKKELYVKKAFDHFGVKGTPALVMLTPDGQYITTIKGYKSGNNRVMLEQIRHNAAIGVKQNADLKKRLAGAGYRSWTGKNGVSIFALPVKFDEKSRTVWFKEYDGTTTKTDISQLNPDDRARIVERFAPKAPKAR